MRDVIIVGCGGIIALFGGLLALGLSSISCSISLPLGLVIVTLQFGHVIIILLFVLILATGYSTASKLGEVNTSEVATAAGTAYNIWLAFESNCITTFWWLELLFQLIGFHFEITYPCRACRLQRSLVWMTTYCRCKL